jgi:hypothetical protein
MSDLPVQPEQSEIDQFPEMPTAPIFVADNTDHKDVATEDKATVEPAAEPEAA